MKPSIASLYQAVEIAQSIPPLLIGERANANGSKAFRECLLADDFEGCLRIAQSQEGEGAHLIDICTAYAGRDELADITKLTSMAAKALKVPVMIDSTTADCIEACLKIYPGRCVVNSVNLEDGGANLDRVLRLVKKYGAAVVALTIDEDGMAMTADKKVEIARRIHDLAVNTYGLRPSDLLFDPLTFTVGAGDETLKDAAVQTLEGIRRIKAELPGVFTMLGLSNISFGLAPAARRVLNSVFLHDAVEAGMDAAIVHAGKVIPLARINEEDREICRDLLLNREKPGTEGPLMTFIEHFSGKRETEEEDENATRSSNEARLFTKVVNGDKEGTDDLLMILLQRHKPVEIINDVLVPSMRHVGDLFGKGELLLPFVLQSAEAMKHCVKILEPLMDKLEDDSTTKVLLATVRGDVHDIGKNLVEIILSNNGYTVYNIGIKMPASTIIAKAREYNVDVIGLSGLLVKSAIVMKETMEQYQEAGLKTPILLGGAALTRKFVAEECVPGYHQPVVYCADAFAGLKAVREFEAGELKATTWEGSAGGAKMKPGPKSVTLDQTNSVPKPPFMGVKYVEHIPLADILPLVNTQALFRGRWGYRRGKMTVDEYETLTEVTVKPLYHRLLKEMEENDLLNLKVAYGYFPCQQDGDSILVDSPDGDEIFSFPRQADSPYLCISDYFKDKDSGQKDVVGFFVASAGEKIAEKTKSLYEEDSYHDYLMLHGLSVEITDALAEYQHAVMRRELGIAADEPEAIGGFVSQQYQGSRYGFGYPSCPDLDAHEPLFRLLKPETIGVTLTENMEMVPEVSTSAIVAHHHQAKYFAV